MPADVADHGAVLDPLDEERAPVGSDHALAMREVRHERGWARRAEVVELPQPGGVRGTGVHNLGSGEGRLAEAPPRPVAAQGSVWRRHPVQPRMAGVLPLDRRAQPLAGTFVERGPRDTEGIVVLLVQLTRLAGELD